MSEGLPTAKSTDGKFLIRLRIIPRYDGDDGTPLRSCSTGFGRLFTLESIPELR